MILSDLIFLKNSVKVYFEQNTPYLNEIELSQSLKSDLKIAIPNIKYIDSKTSYLEINNNNGYNFPNQYFALIAISKDIIIAISDYLVTFDTVRNNIFLTKQTDEAGLAKVIYDINEKYIQTLEAYSIYCLGKDKEFTILYNEINNLTLDIPSKDNFIKFLTDTNFRSTKKFVAIENKTVIRGDRNAMFTSILLQTFPFPNANAEGLGGVIAWILSKNPILLNQLYDEIIGRIKKRNLIISTELEINSFVIDLKESNIKINETAVIQFIASLITKPFVILTGLSGSGKTKLAQAFAMWMCENEEQYCIVPVGADWTNREPLLGFPNALESGQYVKPDNKVLDLIIAAMANESKPYFLILDEMNLSHVERYFADFLSVMESGDEISLHPGTVAWGDVPAAIRLPKNLFIIGTVNIDETTYMFSPKVLDRANVIEFRVSYEEMSEYLSSAKGVDLELLKSKGAAMAESFVQIAADKTLEIKANDKKDLETALKVFFTELKKSGAEFGYRSAAEILRFAAVANKIEPEWTSAQIIDAAIMQKLLPKVHGSRRKLEPVLRTLGSFCLAKGQKIEEYISPKNEIDFSDAGKIIYLISLEKILRMYQGLLDNGFTSYAEA